MKGYIAVALVAGVAVFWALHERDKAGDARDMVRALEARVAQVERQRQIEAQRRDFSESIRDGGDEGLSDYLRDGAGRLWAAPD